MSRVPWGVVDGSDGSVSLFRPDRDTPTWGALVTRAAAGEPVAVAWRIRPGGLTNCECQACGPHDGTRRCPHVRAAQHALSLYRRSVKENKRMTTVPSPAQLDAARAAFAAAARVLLPGPRADLLIDSIDPAKLVARSGSIDEAAITRVLAAAGGYHPKED